MKPEGGESGDNAVAEHAHDWEGFMACHSVGLFCRLHRLSQRLADNLAERAVTWWLHRHPELLPGGGAPRPDQG